MARLRLSNVSGTPSPPLVVACWRGAVSSPEEAACVNESPAYEPSLICCKGLTFCGGDAGTEGAMFTDFVGVVVLFRSTLGIDPAPGGSHSELILKKERSVGNWLRDKKPPQFRSFDHWPLTL